MALGSTQRLNRNNCQGYFLRGKGGRYVRLTLPPPSADCLEIWDPQYPGTHRACPDLHSDSFIYI